ncbi:hypothetical protein ABZS93_04600 [Streptomyces sp900116325]|uniref:hypothetical protein n=1 Tax=Streptomyces sp. 900116325 TaxID=3154295 RepID=UPI0033A07250
MTPPTGSRLGAENLLGAHGSRLALDGADVSIHLGEVAPGTHEAVAAHFDRKTAVRDGRSRDRGHVA